MAPASDEPLLTAGTAVGDYVVEEVFSAGSSSTTYRAREPALDRRVALKLLPRARSADADWVAHFRRGAQLMAAITHPNIVPVYGSGQHAGSEFVAMLFVDGGRALDQAFPPPQDAGALAALLGVVVEIALALEFVHGQGFVHGNVKPSNVMVGARGEAYLIDFDLAERRGEPTRFDLSGDRATALVPPERLIGDHRAEAVVDVFALAATLYAVLVGSPPRHGVALPMATLRPDLPPLLAALVDRALSDIVSQRFATAAALAEALREVAASLTTPAPGRQLGPFRLLDELGRGGMGVVYRAVQEPLGREVALKILPPEFAAVPQRVRRFQREAEVISTLDHPHIIPIWSFGRVGGLYYYAMKLVRGATLAQEVGLHRAPEDAADTETAFFVELASADGVATRAAARPPTSGPVPRVARAAAAVTMDAAAVATRLTAMHAVFIKVARALAHAHSVGIVHRDLKPANIILDGAGEPFLLDFGLARDAGDPGLTETGGLVGTPYYMAPEQVRATGGPPDARTDVWGLGATMYEVLALRRPFDAPSAEGLMLAILADDPPLLRQLQPAVSPEVEAIVAKCLSRDRADRYAGMAELADDLLAALEGRPVAAAAALRRPGAARAEGVRSRWPRAAVGGLVAAFALGVVIGHWLWG